LKEDKGRAIIINDTSTWRGQKGTLAAEWKWSSNNKKKKKSNIRKGKSLEDVLIFLCPELDKPGFYTLDRVESFRTGRL
jgi:hypothetical protein